MSLNMRSKYLKYIIDIDEEIVKSLIKIWMNLCKKRSCLPAVFFINFLFLLVQRIKSYFVF